MSLVLSVEILGEFKKLADATKGSQKSLAGLESSAKSISSGINKTLGAIGVGFSLGFLVNEFKQSTKAAIEDQKSKVLLTKALKDNLKVTDQQVNKIEQYISKTQIATSVTDDKLRPAFSKLAIATKDTDQAMRLMNIALDVSAGTGKNLDAVVQAMSRSLAGSDTALNRLVPSIKGAADPLAELEKMFSGAAEAAANTDPYARINIILGEMQEQIGTELLPILEDFSTWLATPEGQDKIQSIVDGFGDIIRKSGELTDWLDTNVQPALEDLTGEKGFGAVITAVSTLVVVLGTLKIALALYSASALVQVLAGLAALAGAMYLVYQNTKKAYDAQVEFQRLKGLREVMTTPMTSEQVAARTYRGLLETGQVPPPPPNPGRSNQPRGTGVLNNTTVNINGSKLTPAEIVKEIQKWQVQTGSRVLVQ